MGSVLMLAVEKAVSPSEAVESLLAVQAMLIGDAAAQVRRYSIVSVLGSSC